VSRPRSATIPLFPLAHPVLFPCTSAPLHVFEPRYRQMMADALDEERILGMVTVHPDHQGAMEGNPLLFPVGCAGFISDFERLADGRYDLVLQATRRFRLVREHLPTGSRLYRRAEVEWLDETAPVDPAMLAPLRSDVVRSLQELARHARDRAAPEVPVARLAELDDATFTNSLCVVLGMTPAEKQGLLEAPGLAERLAQLDAVLRFHLALLEAPVADPGRTVH
jgi:Lon protease-like protein